MFRRFFDYIDKVFDFGRGLCKITDTRVKPHISTLSVLLSSFTMHVTRLGSLIAMANQLYAGLGIGVDKAVVRQSGPGPP